MRVQDFDFSVDLVQVLLWQYNEALSFQSLILQKQTWYNTNQTTFWIDWYNNVFNLLTANQFGLAVWAIILDIPLFIDPDPEPDDAPIFGFNEDPSINSYFNFTRGNFSSRGTIIVLTLEEQRLLLRLRYYQLVSRGAIPEINTFFNALFGELGGAWVLDGFDMSMTYVFNFYLSKIMRTVIQQLDLLPRPAAVDLKYFVVTGTVFGFGEFNQNFGNGNFIPSNF